jgi:hypothetical protein
MFTGVPRCKGPVTPFVTYRATGVAGNLRCRPLAGEEAVTADVDRGDEPRRERRAWCLRATRGEMFLERL